VSLLPKAGDGCPARRRYRRRQKANGISAGVAVTTVDMCALADRPETGVVTAAEMKLAAKLVMALADRLPEDSAIDVGTACD
jgi:hypothetical protein